MSPDVVVRLAENTVYIILLITAPVMVIGLAVGLLVSVFQATTQIQEQTLAFIPKIVAIFLSVLFFGPWMLNQLLEFATGFFGQLHRFIG